MKKITPLRILMAFVAVFLLGRTLELFDDKAAPHFGLIQLLLALAALILFIMYIYLIIRDRRKK